LIEVKLQTGNDVHQLHIINLTTKMNVCTFIIYIYVFYD